MKLKLLKIDLITIFLTMNPINPLNYEDLTLEELEQEYIKRKIYFRGERARHVFIEKLKEDDRIHQERVNSWSKLPLKGLKKMVKEKDTDYNINIWLGMQNLRWSTITKSQLVEYIIYEEDKATQSILWKERYELEAKERAEWVENSKKRTEQHLESLKKIRKIAKDVDDLWLPLFRKEDKITEEYEYLVKLLILRLGTKKEVTRVIDYTDMPKDILTSLEEKFKKVTGSTE